MKHGVTALVVIDMQNCYLETPPLDERRVNLVAAVNELVDEAVEHHAPVFTVRTEHQAAPTSPCGLRRPMWTRS